MFNSIKNITDKLFGSLKTSHMKPNVIFVLGGPGAGKGTQCQNIVKEYGFAHYSAGDLLREERSKGTEVGDLIEEHIRNGTIVPVEITCRLLVEAMKHNETTNKFLIDGFPRNKDNMDGWNREVGDKANLIAVLFFDCSEDVCIERCLNRGAQGSGRSDDNIDSLKKRINTFHNDSMPIIKYYDEHNLVKRIDAGKPANEVFEQVKQEFSKLNI